MTKPKKILKSFLKPFFSSSNKGKNEEDLETIAAQEQKQFPFEVLVSATKDFHPDHKLGEGGFGPVFKGKLSDGRQIAVKKLSHCSRQGMKEFKNEAKLLARAQHRNVVNLLGYCVHGVEKLLVYEYVANESLDKILFKSANRDALSWRQRQDIIVGIARGLFYLHEGSPTCIIHRDIKASNILLDDKWVPKIADFGMARLYPEDETHVNTRVAGTNGYMAPEYVMYGHLSVKTDVFSFGVVVLELISGQKNSTFNGDPDSRCLLEWADRLYKKGRSWEIMDPALAQSAIPDEIAMYIHIGLLCIQSDPRLRPTMEQVLVMLSKSPGSLDREPTRPGYPGSRIRSHRPGGGTSHTAGTSGASNPSTFSSSSISNTVSATASSSAPTLKEVSEVPQIDEVEAEVSIGNEIPDMNLSDEIPCEVSLNCCTDEEHFTSSAHFHEIDQHGGGTSHTAGTSGASNPSTFSSSSISNTVSATASSSAPTLKEVSEVPQIDEVEAEVSIGNEIPDMNLSDEIPCEVSLNCCTDEEHFTSSAHFHEIDQHGGGTSHTAGTSGASNPSTFSSSSISNTVSATASSSAPTLKEVSEVPQIDEVEAEVSIGNEIPDMNLSDEIPCEVSLNCCTDEEHFTSSAHFHEIDQHGGGTSHTAGTSGASNPSTFSSSSISNTVSATASSSAPTLKEVSEVPQIDEVEAEVSIGNKIPDMNLSDEIPCEVSLNCCAHEEHFTSSAHFHEIDQHGLKEDQDKLVELKLLSLEFDDDHVLNNESSITSKLDEIEEEKVPETPTSNDSFYQLHKKLLLLEKKDFGTESLDGSVVSELEGGDAVSSIEHLKSALKAERKALHALYTELEEERSASAVAANQTMAMINKLQEERSAMQMEALQYQRMMEEQSEYDQKELQLLNELMVKREKEKQELETELEVYRKRLSEYEAKEKPMRMLKRSKRIARNELFSSASCSKQPTSLSTAL